MEAPERTPQPYFILINVQQIVRSHRIANTIPEGRPSMRSRTRGDHHGPDTRQTPKAFPSSAAESTSRRSNNSPHVARGNWLPVARSVKKPNHSPSAEQQLAPTRLGAPHPIDIGGNGPTITAAEGAQSANDPSKWPTRTLQNAEFRRPERPIPVSAEAAAAYGAEQLPRPP